MIYVNVDETKEGININIASALNEVNTDIEGYKNYKLHIATYHQISNARHSPRIKVYSNNTNDKELFSVKIDDDGLEHLHGGGEIKVNKLPKDQYKLYKIARGFADEYGDIIKELQDFRNPPTPERQKEIADFFNMTYNWKDKKNK